jgi:hypothetical protein
MSSRFLARTAVRTLVGALAVALLSGAAQAQKPPWPIPQPTPAAAAQQGASAPSWTQDSLGVARQLTLWFYAGVADSLVARYDNSGSPPTKDAILNQLAQLTTRAGVEEKVLEEKFVKRNGKTQYWRTAKFTQMEEPVLVRWAFSPKGELIGAGLGPKSQAPPIDP